MSLNKRVSNVGTRYATLFRNAWVGRVDSEVRITKEASDQRAAPYVDATNQVMLGPQLIRKISWVV